MRVRAIDWLRGLVMILMTLDHASEAFNKGRLFTDSALFFTPGTPLPATQFFVRWVTHLCAPTFVFLAGASIALSKREDAARFLVTRGLFIAALDPLWMSWMFAPGHVLLQVLWAIGTSFVCMAVLRKLPSAALYAIAIACVTLHELALALPPSIPLALAVTGGFFGTLIVGYPTLPWLGIMLFGFLFARAMPRPRNVALLGVALLAIFVVVRALNGFGNDHLLREDGSLVQWLHVSKYPPSISFTSLELGIALLFLSAFMRVEGLVELRVLDVYGKSAFFFYLLHAHLLKLAAWLLGLLENGTLVHTFLATACVLVLLYPACIAYGRYKQAHPKSVLRYV